MKPQIRTTAALVGAAGTFVAVAMLLDRTNAGASSSRTATRTPDSPKATCAVAGDARAKTTLGVATVSAGMSAAVIARGSGGHAHAAFEIKSAYLVQVTHTAMGALAVVMACARLLELRLPAPASRVAGAASTAAMVMLALVLIFYREANVDIGEMAVAANASTAD